MSQQHTTQASGQGMLERVFKLREHGTTARTEVIAGFTTFLTMVYIVFVNPQILGGALSGGKTKHQETLQTSPDAILNCMTTIIINPELFGAPDCNAQTEAFAEWVKASPHDDDKPILLPGEWEVNTRRERQKQGIPLDAGSWQAICDAARQIGMPEETLQAFCQQLAS